MSDQPLTTYFLGAGFSRCVTGGSAPLMRGFFKDLEPCKYPLLNSFITQTLLLFEETM